MGATMWLATKLGTVAGIVGTAAVLVGVVALINALRNKPYPKVKRDFVIALAVCVVAYVVGGMAG